MKNCTITNNRVLRADGTSTGAAIRYVSDGAFVSLLISYSTLYDNPGGPAVDATLSGSTEPWGWWMSPVSIYGSIIFNPNSPTGVNDLVVTGGVGYGEFNLIGAVSDPSRWNIVSSADPLLGPLQDNGGPTRTMAPLAGSPALDAGHVPLDPTVGWCGVGLEGRVWDDQRGLQRTAGNFDLGSVEAGATGLPSPLAVVANLSRAQPPFETVTGAASGQPPEVRVYDSNKKEVKRFLAYHEGFLGGVNVAIGYINGDAIPDIITAAGSGGGPHVKVFDGNTFEEIASFYAYDPGFAGGVSVAVGDVNGDGRPEIVTGAGPGGGPHVKVFDGWTLQEIAGFYAYDPGFTGGVSVAVKAAVRNDASLSGQIVTGAGAGGGPHVKVFDANTLAEVQSFYAYAPDFAGGVNVAADNYGRIITGAGSGGGPHLKVFDTFNSVLTEALSMYTTTESDSGGVRVGVSDFGWVMAVTQRSDGETESERLDFRFIQLGYGPIPPELLPRDNTFPSDLGAIGSIGGPTVQLIRTGPVVW